MVARRARWVLVRGGRALAAALLLVARVSPFQGVGSKKSLLFPLSALVIVSAGALFPLSRRDRRGSSSSCDTSVTEPDPGLERGTAGFGLDSSLALLALLSIDSLTLQP